MRRTLALAHERSCEADLAAVIAERLNAAAIPDMTELRARFAPDPGALPVVTVSLAPLSAYDALRPGRGSSSMDSSHSPAGSSSS